MSEREQIAQLCSEIIQMAQAKIIGAKVRKQHESRYAHHVETINFMHSLRRHYADTQPGS